MIFATCGSSHFGFDRMMQALASLPAEDLYVQYGPAAPPPGARAVKFLPFDEVVDNIARAEVVVSHAGVGSILCAIRAGHTPVVFPRLRRYHEAVDDHQAELAEALAQQGSAVVAWTAEDLPAAVASAPPRRGVNSVGPKPLVDAVRATILSGDRRGGAGDRRRLVGDLNSSQPLSPNVASCAQASHPMARWCRRSGDAAEQEKRGAMNSAAGGTA